MGREVERECPSLGAVFGLCLLRFTLLFTPTLESGRINKCLIPLVPGEGLEPPTNGLQNRSRLLILLGNRGLRGVNNVAESPSFSDLERLS